MTRLCVLLLALSSSAPLIRAQDPSYYAKRPTWEETAQAAIDSLTLLRSRHVIANPVTLGSWVAIGPFGASAGNAFAEAFPPESEFAPDTAYGGKGWTPRPEWKDGSICMFPNVDFSAMYLSRTIGAPHDTTLLLSLGSDDGIKVWLDGVLLLQHDVSRGVAPDQETIDLKVRGGDHRLLMKISNGQGDFGFFFNVADAEIRGIWNLVGRDFPAWETAQEMGWEAEDSIWSASWTPGDVGPLALRYARATIVGSPEEHAAALAEAASARTGEDLGRIRTRYLLSRRIDVTPVILTPKPPDRPRINGPGIFGVRPGHPFLYTIPASGKRPMRYGVKNLPSELRLDTLTGRITGVVTRKGRYITSLSARNSAGVASRRFTIVAGDAIALTPPLGWNSWNCFASSVSDAHVRAASDAMVGSGLINHGWTYINIDDCWEVKPGSTDTLLAGEPRQPGGMINTNKKFPDMKALGDYVHARGLKLGIYSSPGPLTCAGYTASYQHERHDAARYAAWGIDYLKYDWCSYGTIEKKRTTAALALPYRLMREALESVDRDIVFSLCQYGMGNVWEWGSEVGGNSWRTTGDIEDTWESMSGIGFSQAGHELYAGPGHWNDPDMLVVGKVGWGSQLHPTRLTPNEQYTHVTLWTLLNSPLLIGCDMTQMDEFTLSLLTNDEVLDVHQDIRGKQASRIRKDGDIEIWAKDLDGGARAVGLFNRGRWKADITLPFADLGLKGSYAARDLWRQQDLGVHAKDITRSVPRHGVVLLRLTAIAPH